MAESPSVDVLAVPFLELLGVSARADLEQLGTRRSLKASAMVMVEGEKANRVGIVRSGLVKLTASHSDGFETMLAIRGVGELIGELSAFDGGVRSASVETLVPSEIQLITIAEFVRLIEAHPSAATAVIRTLVARLRESDDHRVRYGTDGVARRLARELLRLAGEHGRIECDGVITIDLPFTQDDLAGAVSASRDAVARALRDWRGQGLVSTGRRRIVLLDPAALSRRHRL